jgi:hypothetical protein
MSAPLPFTVSTEADQRLRRVAEVPDKEPGIFYTFRYDIQKDGELREEFNEEHYSIGFDSPENWVSVRSGVRVTIAGREFWLSPDTVDRLKGKRLAVIQREVGRGRYAGKIRDLLVSL